MKKLIKSLLLFIISLQCPASESGNIQIGDLLRINLPGEMGFNKDFQVDRRGFITLPEVGPVLVAGYDGEQAKELILDRLSAAYRNLTSADVYVQEKQVLITVMGYVENPGEFNLPHYATVQSALYTAGGIRAGAQLNKLQLRRGDAVSEFNYKDYLDTGDSRLLPSLQTLDVIFVPSSPLVGNIEQDFDPSAQANSGDSSDHKTGIKVFGEVNSPGTFSYKPDITLVDVLMRSGGVTRYASVEQIRVIADNQPSMFNLKRYLDTGNSAFLPDLLPGTTIFVPRQDEEIKSGANVVYVMGEVAEPGAYESKQEATFMDILANAGGPTRFAESRQIRVIKASGRVVNFDLTAFTEGLSTSVPQIKPGDAIFVPEKTDMNEKSWLKVAPNRAVRVIGEVVRPGRIEWANEMDLMDLLAHVGGPTLRADTTRIEIIPSANQQEMIVFNLDAYIKKGAPIAQLPKVSAGAIIRVHDLPQDPSDNKSQWVRQSSDRSIYVFGQVNAPGRYRFTEEMHFLDILSAADGPTGEADIHNIRVTHRDKSYAKVSKLNLALYFETGDENLLPEVNIGDTIFIPEKDRNWLERPKEKTVRVLGAINNPGRYQFDDSMTILDMLAQAGGPSESAYLEKITIVNISCCQNQARTFDLIEFSKTANIYQLPLLRAGDTIFIPDQSDSLAEKLRVGLKDILQLATTIVLIGAI
ncbi:SLBB domain-containing protein [Vibrio sp. HN007]|uniref:SLBB domain-containing protein n=1 Tax=Vibrio iocasae TaxID=3098914 RepID=UPI0035D4E2E2